MYQKGFVDFQQPICHGADGTICFITFFLSCIMQDEVRRLAAQMGLPNQGRKDSQGICFLGKVSIVPAFLVINVLGK